MINHLHELVETKTEFKEHFNSLNSPKTQLHINTDIVLNV